MGYQRHSNGYQSGYQSDCQTGGAQNTGTELSQGPKRTSTSTSSCPRLSPEPEADYNDTGYDEGGYQCGCQDGYSGIGYGSGSTRTTGTELSRGPTRTSSSEPCPRLSPEPICNYGNVDHDTVGANLPNGLPSAGNNLSARGTSSGFGSVRPPALVKDDASVGFGSVRPPKRRRVVGKSSIAS